MIPAPHRVRALALAALLPAGPLLAQSRARLVQAVATLAAPSAQGWQTPQQVAADGAGNLYVNDTTLGGIWKLGTAGGATLVQGVAAPGLAVDAAGDVFTISGAAVKVVRPDASGGYGGAVPLPLALPSQPLQIALDGKADLYLWIGAQILVAPPPYSQMAPLPMATGGVGGGTVPSAPPQAFAVDAQGDVFLAYSISGFQFLVAELRDAGTQLYTPYTSKAFLAPTLLNLAADGAGGVLGVDRASGQVFRAVPPNPPQAGVAWSFTPVGQALPAAAGLALAGPGTLGLLTRGGSGVPPAVLRVQTAPAPVQYGAVPGQRIPPVQTLTFRFTAAGALGAAPQVLSAGVSGGVYGDAGTGSLTAQYRQDPAHAYQVGDLGTVDVAWVLAVPPGRTASGARAGAVVLLDAAQRPMATAYLAGSVGGPQLAYSPSQPSVLAYPPSTGAPSPAGLAVDGDGNVAVADASLASLLLATPTVGVPVGNPDWQPTSVALDGAGNLYFTSRGGAAVIKETLVPGTRAYLEAPLDPLIAPNGVAVDGAGVVYASDPVAGAVWKETPDPAQPTGYALSRFPVQAGPGGPDLAGLACLAADVPGNVYLGLDPGGGAAQVWKVAPDGTPSLVLDGLASVRGLAVDGNGAVFVCDPAAGTVTRAFPGAGGYVGATWVAHPAPYVPVAVAVDAGDDLFVADAGGAQVWKEDFSSPPTVDKEGADIGFQALGSVTLQNVGNAGLAFADAPAGSTNPAPPASVTQTWFDPASQSLVTRTVDNTYAPTGLTAARSYFSLDPGSGLSGAVLPPGGGIQLVFDWWPDVSGLYTATVQAADQAGRAFAIHLRGLVPVVAGENQVEVVLDPAGLNPVYDGRPKTVAAWIDAPLLQLQGAPVVTYYDCPGQPPPASCRIPPPVHAGTYYVYAAFTDSSGQYHGAASGTLVIAPAPVQVRLHRLFQVYDGRPRRVVATASAPVRLRITYTGIAGTRYPASAVPPVRAGRYAVVATVVPGDYQGGAAGVLVVAGSPGSGRPTAFP